MFNCKGKAITRNKDQATVTTLFDVSVPRAISLAMGCVAYLLTVPILIQFATAKTEGG